MKRYALFVVVAAALSLICFYRADLVEMARSRARSLGLSAERMPYPDPSVFRIDVDRQAIMHCPNGSVIYRTAFLREGEDWYEWIALYDSRTAERPFILIHFKGLGEFKMLYLDRDKDGIVDHKAPEPDEKFGDGPCDVLPADAPRQNM